MPNGAPTPFYCPHCKSEQTLLLREHLAVNPPPTPATKKVISLYVNAVICPGCKWVYGLFDLHKEP